MSTLQRLQLDGAAIVRTVVGPLKTNVYLLLVDGAPAVLVDAADDAAWLLRVVETSAPDGVGTIVTTHSHHDHVQALAEVAAATGARCVSSVADAPEIERQTGVRPEPIGSTLDLGGQVLDVIELRGHTPGGIALAWQPGAEDAQLFVGDSLFPGGVGKTYAKKDFTRLLTDVTERLFDAYDDDAVVHPGHGEPTRLGIERPHLGEWRKRGW